MTGLKRKDLIVETGAHVRVIGKGRKERCIPVAKPILAVFNSWLRDAQRGSGSVLFPSAKGNRFSVHGVQYLLNKHRKAASSKCPSVAEKRVTVHRMRHTMAMDLLQAGVDRSVIALWLGHEYVETTQIYLDATLEIKEQALAKTTPPESKSIRSNQALPNTNLSTSGLIIGRSCLTMCQPQISRYSSFLKRQI